MKEQKPLEWPTATLLAIAWISIAVSACGSGSGLTTIFCVGFGYYLTKVAITGSTDS